MQKKQTSRSSKPKARTATRASTAKKNNNKKNK
jgi:hypothetical protein